MITSRASAASPAAGQRGNPPAPGRAEFRPHPAQPGPSRPAQPGPGYPAQPGHTPLPGPRVNPALQHTRVWFDQGDWQSHLYGRLLDHRIVMAHGFLDGEAATRLSAQLLTLDAEGTAPIRLELQNLDADLQAALSVMGVMDVLRVPVTACVAGCVRGPALGVLAAAGQRQAYPNATFVLCEPRVSFDGPVAAAVSQEEHVRVMLAELVARLASVTGREPAAIAADAAAERLLTVDQAISYGLIEGGAEPRPAPPGLT